MPADLLDLLVEEVHQVPLVSAQVVDARLAVPEVHGLVPLPLERPLRLRAPAEVMRAVDVRVVLRRLLVVVRRVLILMVVVTIILGYLLE